MIFILRNKGGPSSPTFNICS